MIMASPGVVALHFLPGFDHGWCRRDSSPDCASWYKVPYKIAVKQHFV